MKTNKGLAIATAAAALILAGSLAGRAAEGEKAGGEVSCAGINACKGQGACAGGSSGNSCAGRNACKGKGVTMVSSAEECVKKGGKVVEGHK